MWFFYYKKIQFCCSLHLCVGRNNFIDPNVEHISLFWLCIGRGLPVYFLLNFVILEQEHLEADFYVKHYSFLLKLLLQMFFIFRWSTRIYFKINKLMDPSCCASLCLLNGTCHFNLVLNGNCYLGNILYNTSILVNIIDSQNINILQGTDMMFMLSDYW